MTDFDCQLYLISPQDVTGEFPKRLEMALAAAPVAAFQFRVKGVGHEEAIALAQPLQAICAKHDVAFIVNDDVTLAKQLQADGVHLGQSDGDAKEARSILGPDIQIGITCNNSKHLAMEAGDAGADYVAFGAFFPTETKVVEHMAEPEILSWWQQLFELPCVAIGGITVDNAAALVEAGADFLAVSGGVWTHAEGPDAAVKQFAAIMKRSKPES